MQCRELMSKNVACCVPSDTVQQAAQLMQREDVGPIPVVESQTNKRVVGIVTDRDLALEVVAEARDPKTVKVRDVMTTSVVTCREHDDLQKAIDAMEREQVRRIPVVDDQNRIAGIIAQADIATRSHQPQKTAEVVQEVSKPRVAGGGGV